MEMGDYSREYGTYRLGIRFVAQSAPTNGAGDVEGMVHQVGGVYASLSDERVLAASLYRQLWDQRPIDVPRIAPASPTCVCVCVCVSVCACMCII